MIHYPIYDKRDSWHAYYLPGWVELTAAERTYLPTFTSQGKQRVRALKRAQVLLLADGGSRREVEIAIGTMSRQCPDRRIDSMELLEPEPVARETRRNEERAGINWMFNVDTARSKLHRAYEQINRPELN